MNKEGLLEKVIRKEPEITKDKTIKADKMFKAANKIEAK